MKTGVCIQFDLNVHADVSTSCLWPALIGNACLFIHCVKFEVLLYRAMAVLDPLKVTITNFPSDQSSTLTVPNFPADEKRGSHSISFKPVLYIEKSDFREVKRYHSHLSLSLFVHCMFKYKCVMCIELGFWIIPNWLCLQSADKNYKRFAENQPVGLRHAGYVLTAENVIKVRNR